MEPQLAQTLRTFDLTTLGAGTYDVVFTDDDLPVVRQPLLLQLINQRKY
jgi:hypothetical protein